MNKNLNLTQDNIYKSMVLFAIPIFLSNLFQQLYNSVDTLIVGNFINENALAAVGSSSSLIFLMTGFVNGLSMGAGVIIAKYFGASDSENLNKSINTTILMGLILGASLTLFGVILSPIILKLMGTPNEVLPNSLIYFRVYFMGSISVVMYNCASSVIQSIGDSKSPMRYLIFSSIINIILDLLFIVIFKMGVGGAALATIISQTISALLAINKLFTFKKEGRAYGLSISELKFDLDMFKEILNQGIPSGLQNSVISIANIVVQSNINAFGSIAMAGCATYSKVEGFAFLPVTCFSMSLATFVSQNVGANKMDRVKKGIVFGCVSAIVLSIFVSIGLIYYSPQIIGLFSNDSEVIMYGVKECHVQPYFFAFLTFSHCAAGALRGLGKPMIPMVVMLSDWCLLRITYITIMIKFINKIEVVFWAYPITWTISTILFLIYLIRYLFKNENVY